MIFVPDHTDRVTVIRQVVVAGTRRIVDRVVDVKPGSALEDDIELARKFST